MSEELEYKEELPVELKAGETLVLDITARLKKEEEPSGITTGVTASVELEIVDKEGGTIPEKNLENLSVILLGEDGTRFKSDEVKNGKARFINDIPSGTYSVRFDTADVDVELLSSVKIGLKDITEGAIFKVINHEIDDEKIELWDFKMYRDRTKVSWIKPGEDDFQFDQTRTMGNKLPPYTSSQAGEYLCNLPCETFIRVEAILFDAEKDSEFNEAHQCLYVTAWKDSDEFGEEPKKGFAWTVYRGVNFIEPYEVRLEKESGKHVRGKLISKITPGFPIALSTELDELITVHVKIEDEHGNPYKEGLFELTRPDCKDPEEWRTDLNGEWTQDNLLAGMYTIKVQGWEITELPSGQTSTPSFKKKLNAADNNIQIQVIDLNKWFVQKTKDSSEIPQFSKGNIVEPLIDGEEMMAAIYKDFASTQSTDHYIYITAWQMDKDVRLLRGSSESEESAVIRVLVDAIIEGVDVRAMLWHFFGMKNRAEFELINFEFRSPYRGQAILDKAPLPGFGSHHQKTAVVNGPDGLIAYCGGIDLAEGRWDTTSHESTKPWHDVHTRIRGPAAGDIETNFRERWNNHPDSTEPNDDVRKHLAPEPIEGKSHLVQTLRTISPQLKYEFAKNGEFDILNAYKKAISKAREYIYIEDQYFISEEICNEINQRLNSPSGKEVKVIIVVPLIIDSPWWPLWEKLVKFVIEIAEKKFQYRRCELINQLKKGNPDKVKAYYLRNKTGQNIKVHSKLMIIDDIWAIIGSANFNRRSMTYDTEIDVAVIDGEVKNRRRKFARDLRIRLWAEHLGVSQPKVDDWREGITLWVKREKNEQRGHTVELKLKSLLDETIEDDDLQKFLNDYDPDGRK